jgi:lipopolysaccharide/colanic/teichoic acid biosynthesis glycosyltransferase
MCQPNDRSQFGTKFAWLSLSLIAIILLAWLRFKNQTLLTGEKGLPFQIWIELAIYLLLSFALSGFLKIKSLNNHDPYHLAVITTVGLGAILTVVSSFDQVNIYTFGFLSLVAVSSFWGGFIASSISHGWWENNAPPPPDIEKDVLRRHKAYPINKAPFQKRVLDIAAALISLIISLPIWLIVIALIWWEDPGPVLFVKNSVGRGGVNFKQLKFRSMNTNAEKTTGAISTYKHDERILPFGKLLRKTALDELPQLINILIGDMSYVGPRPQRTILVHQYLKATPEYAARHQVRPGLAGLAQVADGYSISQEEKLAWDLIYIDNANVWFDLKLICAAFLLVFGLRWQTNTTPEIRIRKLLNFEKPLPKSD